MAKKRKNYIQNNVRAFYRTRIICPIILMVVLVALSITTPVKTMFKPREARLGASLKQLYDNNDTFINVTFEKLYFTGYTNETLGKVRGYYYYTRWGNGYIIVLVSPSTCQQGIPQMDSLTCAVKIEESPRVFDSLFEYMASDLNWDRAGISSRMSSYLLSEPAARSFMVILALLIYAAAFIYGAGNFIAYFIYIVSPILSPFLRPLGAVSEAKKRLMDAEEELALRPQLSSDDMFITENYFIEVSESELIVLPLTSIVWVYRHAGLHFIFGRIRPVRECLYIITSDGHTYKCAALVERDIDGVIDYISEAVPGVLVGYSEENRLAAQKKQAENRKKNPEAAEVAAEDKPDTQEKPSDEAEEKPSDAAEEKPEEKNDAPEEKG